MITQQHINQFKDIIDNIEKDTLEMVRFKKAFELCNLIFQTAKFDLVKLSEDEDFSLDLSIELDGISESLNIILSPLLNNIDKNLNEFKSSVEININNLKNLNKEYDEKQRELKNLIETQEEYKKLSEKLNQIKVEIKNYKEIDLELISNELRIKQEELEKLKKGKEPLILVWKKHLEENEKIDISIEEINKISEDIGFSLKKMDSLFQDKIKGDM